MYLYEHNYTLFLAIKWQYLIHLANRKRLLHPHQYGATLGGNSVTPTVLKELKYEIS